ncbi:MAG: ROK family protein [Planctomycetota bacterium]
MSVLAADIGGTSIKLGVVEAGRVSARGRIEVVDRATLRPLLPALVHAWRDLLGRPVDPERDRAAVAFPGIVDAAGTEVLSVNGKFLDAPEINWSAWAQDALRLPVLLENDARAACLGEWRCGAGRGCDDMAMMTLGTGIGTSAIVQGRPIRGGHGQAGVLGGHLTIDLHGGPCSCGNVGCAEAVASTDRLREHLAEAQRDTDTKPSSLDPETASYLEVVRAAQAGDGAAAHVMRQSVRAWGITAVNLIHAYDASRLVIGGGVARAGSAVIDGIRDHVHRHAWTPWGTVDVRPGELGDDAALLGLPFIQEPPPPETATP